MSIAAYLLDPSAATIRPVQIEPATIFDTARFLVGADYLALHQIDKRHTAYVDDDGLSKPVTGMFTVAGREGTRPLPAARGSSEMTPQGTPPALLSLRSRPSRGS